MLIKCPECGKEVSDNATVCVHCGYPLTQKKEAMSKEIQARRKDGLVVASNIILGVFGLLVAYGVLTSKGGVAGNTNAAAISWLLMVGVAFALFSIKKLNRMAAKVSGALFVIAGVVSALSLFIAPAYLLLAFAILLNAALTGRYLKKNNVY